MTDFVRSHPWLAGYLLVVSATGIFSLFRILISLRRIRTLMLTRLGQSRRFEPTTTDGPFPPTEAVALERGEASIQQQFSVTSKVAIPTVIIITVFFLGIPFVGAVPQATLSVVIAAVTVLAGVAARPILENLMAGVVISGSRMLNLGDTVEIMDLYGTIEDIGPTHTVIKVWDWRRLVLPNSTMLESTLLNYTLYDRFIWTHVDFWVAYQADLEQVQRAAIECAEACAYLRKSEAPECWITEMGQGAVRLRVAAWAESPASAWELRNELRLRLIRHLNAMGVLTHLHQHHVQSSGPWPQGQPDHGGLSETAMDPNRRSSSTGRSASGASLDPSPAG